MTGGVRPATVGNPAKLPHWLPGSGAGKSGPRLAEATLAARLADLEGAAALLAEPVRFSLLGA